jgi:hypothetical protein
MKFVLKCLTILLLFTTAFLMTTFTLEPQADSDLFGEKGKKMNLHFIVKDNDVHLWKSTAEEPEKSYVGIVSGFIYNINGQDKNRRFVLEFGIVVHQVSKKKTLTAKSRWFGFQTTYDVDSSWHKAE